MCEVTMRPEKANPCIFEAYAVEDPFGISRLCTVTEKQDD